MLLFRYLPFWLWGLLAEADIEPSYNLAVESFQDLRTLPPAGQTLTHQPEETEPGTLEGIEGWLSPFAATVQKSLYLNQPDKLKAIDDQIERQNQFLTARDALLDRLKSLKVSSGEHQSIEELETERVKVAHLRAQHLKGLQDLYVVASDFVTKWQKTHFDRTWGAAKVIKADPLPVHSQPQQALPPPPANPQAAADEPLEGKPVVPPAEARAPSDATRTLPPAQGQPPAQALPPAQPQPAAQALPPAQAQPAPQAQPSAHAQPAPQAQAPAESQPSAQPPVEVQPLAQSQAAVQAVLPASVAPAPAGPALQAVEEAVPVVRHEQPAIAPPGAAVQADAAPAQPAMQAPFVQALPNVQNQQPAQAQPLPQAPAASGAAQPAALQAVVAPTQSPVVQAQPAQPAVATHGGSAPMPQPQSNPSQALPAPPAASTPNPELSAELPPAEPPDEVPPPAQVDPQEAVQVAAPVAPNMAVAVEQSARAPVPAQEPAESAETVVAQPAAAQSAREVPADQNASPEVSNSPEVSAEGDQHEVSADGASSGDIEWSRNDLAGGETASDEERAAHEDRLARRRLVLILGERMMSKVVPLGMMTIERLNHLVVGSDSSAVRDWLRKAIGLEAESVKEWGGLMWRYVQSQYSDPRFGTIHLLWDALKVFAVLQALLSVRAIRKLSSQISKRMPRDNLDKLEKDMKDVKVYAEWMIHETRKEIRTKNQVQELEGDVTAVEARRKAERDALILETQAMIRNELGSFLSRLQLPDELAPSFAPRDFPRDPSFAPRDFPRDPSFAPRDFPKDEQKPVPVIPLTPPNALVPAKKDGDEDVTHLRRFVETEAAKTYHRFSLIQNGVDALIVGQYDATLRTAEVSCALLRLFSAFSEILPSLVDYRSCANVLVQVDLKAKLARSLMDLMNSCEIQDFLSARRSGITAEEVLMDALSLAQSSSPEDSCNSVRQYLDLRFGSPPMGGFDESDSPVDKSIRPYLVGWNRYRGQTRRSSLSGSEKGESKTEDQRSGYMMRSFDQTSGPIPPDPRLVRMTPQVTRRMTTESPLGRRKGTETSIQSNIQNPVSPSHSTISSLQHPRPIAETREQRPAGDSRSVGDTRPTIHHRPGGDLVGDHRIAADRRVAGETRSVGDSRPAGDHRPADEYHHEARMEEASHELRPAERRSFNEKSHSESRKTGRTPMNPTVLDRTAPPEAGTDAANSFPRMRTKAEDPDPQRWAQKRPMIMPVHQLSGGRDRHEHPDESSPNTCGTASPLSDQYQDTETRTRRQGSATRMEPQMDPRLGEPRPNLRESRPDIGELRTKMGGPEPESTSLIGETPSFPPREASMEESNPPRFGSGEAQHGREASFPGEEMGFAPPEVDLV